ncbi:MAG: hypothetical protein Kow0020_01550 [Wenzhouxiangellaceae bacterium]
MPGETRFDTLIQLADDGDEAARLELSARLYSELRGVARRQLLGGKRDRTLNTTALVHETFLRLARLEQVEFGSRERFLAYSARVMRSVLVDEARHKTASRHGGELHRVEWREDQRDHAMSPEELVALDQALNDLQEVDERLVRVIELRVFGGLTLAECAAVLGVSQRTVTRLGRLAWAMLMPLLEHDPGQA